MRVGVSMRSGYVTEARTGARWMIERARAANGAGLDSLFVGDHHSTAPGVYYQNVPMVGRLLAEWGDNPAGALFLLPLWHPVLLAEQIGTLASIAAGRFVMQTAIGGGAEQFGALGVPLRGRAARFESGLDTVRRLLAGEEVDGARIAPVTPEPLEVWIGGTAEPAIDRAARLGDGWLANADGVPDAARAQAALYLERCAAYSRTPTAVGGATSMWARAPRTRSAWPGRSCRAATGDSIPTPSCTGASSRSPTASVLSPRWATPTSSCASSRPSRRTRWRRSNGSPRCASWSPTPDRLPI